LRPGIFLSALLLAASASAQDARVKLLTKQLQTAKDARLRAQACTLLGNTGTEEAVTPLCGALDDKDSLVRSAAAGALGELGTPEAGNCLKAALGVESGAVKKAIEKALAAMKPSGALYIAIEPVENKASVSSDVLNTAHELLRREVSAMGATVAPAGESESQTNSIVKSNGYRGFLLKTKLLPNGSSGLKIEVLIMKLPGNAMQGSWNVKAAGGKPEAQLKALVPRVVSDAANDLEWK
jgi:hypothetical protein